MAVEADLGDVLLWLDTVEDQGYALFEASRLGLHSWVWNALEKGVKTDFLEGSTLRTPLHAAALNNHADVVGLLIGAGADVEAKDAEGMKPSEVADVYGHHEISELIRRAEPSHVTVSFTSRSGRETHTSAHRMRRLDDVQLDESDPGQSPSPSLRSFRRSADAEVYEACREGNVPLLLVTLQNQARTDYHEEETGWTPLHVAAREGQVECARILIEAGADIDAEDKLNLRPLDVAEASGSERVSQLLKNARAKLQEQTQASPSKAVSALRRISSAMSLKSLSPKSNASSPRLGAASSSAKTASSALSVASNPHAHTHAHAHAHPHATGKDHPPSPRATQPLDTTQSTLLSATGNNDKTRPSQDLTRSPARDPHGNTTHVHHKQQSAVTASPVSNMEWNDYGQTHSTKSGSVRSNNLHKRCQCCDRSFGFTLAFPFYRSKSQCTTCQRVVCTLCLTPATPASTMGKCCAMDRVKDMFKTPPDFALPSLPASELEHQLGRLEARQREIEAAAKASEERMRDERKALEEEIRKRDIEIHQLRTRLGSNSPPTHPSKLARSPTEDGGAGAGAGAGVEQRSPGVDADVWCLDHSTVPVRKLFCIHCNPLAEITQLATGNAELSYHTPPTRHLGHYTPNNTHAQQLQPGSPGRTPQEEKLARDLRELERAVNELESPTTRRRADTSRQRAEGGPSQSLLPQDFLARAQVSLSSPLSSPSVRSVIRQNFNLEHSPLSSPNAENRSPHPSAARRMDGSPLSQDNLSSPSVAASPTSVAGGYESGYTDSNYSNMTQEMSSRGTSRAISPVDIERHSPLQSYVSGKWGVDNNEMCREHHSYPLRKMFCTFCRGISRDPKPL